MLLYKRKLFAGAALLTLLCCFATHFCHAQAGVAAQPQRRPSSNPRGNDAAEFNDDDDFSEFDDDEFEHAAPQRADSNEKLGKAELPPITLKPVQDQQQQQEASPSEKQPNKPSSKLPAGGAQSDTGTKAASAKQAAANFDEETTVEVEGEDVDADEFESDTMLPHSTLQSGKSKANDAGKSSSSVGADKSLKIADVPISLQRRWINYTSEGLMVAIVVIYVTMYITGRVLNQRLATTWLEYHRDLLEQEFAFVGVPGDKLENVEEQDQKTNSEILHKEYDHVYTVWCTGRAGIDGMLVQLELLRRQDLVGSVIKLVRGNSDRVSFKVLLETGYVDNFVFAMIKKQQAATYAKDMSDLAYFCPERRPGDRFGIPESYSVMSEIGEVATALFDREFVRMLTEHEQSIELLHISDHYIRTRQEEETALNAGNTPETKKIILFTVKLPANKSSQDAMRDLVPVTQFFFYLLEKLSRFHLSREGKAKADKNRATLQQRYIKATHTQRSEAAQQRKEDKRKAEKEKMLNEQDPDKQRKWEEREYKRDMKKRGPKIKQMKVKSM